MTDSPSLNPRPLEPRLAPRFHALEVQFPPDADAPMTQQRAEALVADAIQWKASDLHLEPGSGETRLRMRLDGVLYDVAAIPDFSGHRLVAYFKTLSGIDATALSTPEHGHGRMEAGGTVVELRTTVAPTPAGEMAGIRLLDTRRPLLRLHDLGMRDEDQAHLREWLSAMQGLVLVAGPVGSGKTSTLYALLHELQLLPRSIVTVEDPVECELDGITQIEVNHRRGMTFPEAIRAMLRLDPDFLLVGEIRDPESAHVAITAAGSGHALLSTIHGRDVTGAVTTLRNNGVKNWEIAAALEICISQRLVRRLCLKCRIPDELFPEQQAWFEDSGLTPPDTMWKPVGCDACAGTGFDGRVGIFEIWRIDPASRKLILGGAEEHTLAAELQTRGQATLFHDAIGKVAGGLTSLSEIAFLSAQGFSPSRLPASRPSPRHM